MLFHSKLELEQYANQNKRMLNNIAIIAGSGKLPFLIANHLKKLKTKFIVLSIKGFSDIDLYLFFYKFIYVKINLY